MQGRCSAPLRSRFRQVLELQPYSNAELQEILTSAGARLGFLLDVDLALEIARRLCEATEYKDILALDVLAAAYAETGDFAHAEATIRKATETPLGQTPNNVAELQKRLMLYQAHQKPLIRTPAP